MSGALLGAELRQRLRAHLARVAAEASAAHEPRLAALRFTAPVCDALDVFAAAAGDKRFHFEAPSRGIAIAAAGEAAHIETAGRTRFADAAIEVRALFAALRTAVEDPSRAAGAARAAGALSAAGAAGAVSASGAVGASSSLGDARAVAATAPPPEAGPILVGGFAFGDTPSARGAFAGFPALSFTLPSVSFVRRGDEAWCTLAARLSRGDDPEAIARALEVRAETLLASTAPGDSTPTDVARFGAVADRSPDEYLRGVARALAAIAAGELEKVVLARACTVTRPGGFDAARVLATLRAAHPRCVAFGVGRDDACFVGATPERLLRREGDRVASSALAGSAPRGRTPEEDACLASALRESKKEQAEHAIVRRAIAAALAPVCDALDVPEAPDLLRLDGIQHLHTPIEGRLRAGEAGDALALVERLHPTPAVSGAPRAAALAFLAARERLERGWYAGGVGWLAPGGDGEIAVALRCALLRDRRATLHAGAGIVEGSQPEAELAETRLKLRAALGALVEL